MQTTKINELTERIVTGLARLRTRLSSAEQATEEIAGIKVVLADMEAAVDALNTRFDEHHLETVDLGDRITVAETDIQMIGNYGPRVTAMEKEYEAHLFAEHFAGLDASYRGKMPETMNKTFSGQVHPEFTKYTRLPVVDTSGTLFFRNTIENLTGLKEFPRWDFSNAEGITWFAHGTDSISSIPVTPNISAKCKVINALYTNGNNNSLTSIPYIDLSHVENAQCIYNGLKAVTEWPEMDLSSAKNLGMSFNNCRHFGDAELEKVTWPASLDTAQQMLEGTGIVHFRGIDTSQWKNMEWMLRDCPNLVYVEADLSSETTGDMLTLYSDNVRFMHLSNFGKGIGADVTTMYWTNDRWGVDDSGTETGPDGMTARESLTATLVTESYDLAAAGHAAVTLHLSSTTKSLLTAEEKAAITAKGYTIV